MLDINHASFNADMQAKADRNATELALVLRRERAGQSSIADAQVEVEDLKAELSEMRDAFAK